MTAASYHHLPPAFFTNNLHLLNYTFILKIGIQMDFIMTRYMYMSFLSDNLNLNMPLGFLLLFWLFAGFVLFSHFD